MGPATNGDALRLSTLEMAQSEIPRLVEKVDGLADRLHDLTELVRRHGEALSEVAIDTAGKNIRGKAFRDQVSDLEKWCKAHDARRVRERLQESEREAASRASRWQWIKPWWDRTAALLLGAIAMWLGKSCQP